jgi:hypothetical protein
MLQLQAVIQVVLAMIQDQDNLILALTLHLNQRMKLHLMGHLILA